MSVSELQLNFLEIYFFKHFMPTVAWLADARERLQVYGSFAGLFQKHNPLWVIVLEGMEFHL